MLKKSFLFLVIFANTYVCAMEGPHRPIAIPGFIMMNGNPINSTKSGTGWTEVHDAAYFGLLPLLERLIKERKSSGQSIDPEDIYRQTPLWWAAKRGQAAAIQLLVEHGADIEHTDIGGRSPASLMQHSPKLLNLIHDIRKGTNQ